MFSFNRPTRDEIRKKQAAVQRQPAFAFGVESERVPFPFVKDLRRAAIGRGRGEFEKAIALMKAWRHFDLGWTKVVDDRLPIENGAIVGVMVKSLGLWSVNFSEIVQVINERDLFGYIYRTTRGHIECGEERFLLEFNEASGSVDYELRAFSKPAAVLAWMGYPVTRIFQRRFALQSIEKMRLPTNT